MVDPSYGLPSIDIPAEFQWRLGGEGDRPRLQHCLQLAFAEAFPEQTSWGHLSQTVERYFSPSSSPLWWIDCICSKHLGSKSQAVNPSNATAQQLSDSLSRSAVACVWVTRGVGQATGCPVAYIMALWVSPNYRRQGLGSAALQAVREWGERVGCTAIELQVFGRNQSAHRFYRAQGFGEVGSWLQLPLQNV
ncbi:MAG: GNAT family N-acetyltransferase [Cyanobacteria bacterium P01_E01_bin.34]